MLTIRSLSHGSLGKSACLANANPVRAVSSVISCHVALRFWAYSLLPQSSFSPELPGAYLIRWCVCLYLLDKQLRAEGVSVSPEASRHLSEIAEAIKELVKNKYMRTPCSWRDCFVLFMKPSLVKRGEKISRNHFKMGQFPPYIKCVSVRKHVRSGIALVSFFFLCRWIYQANVS